MLNALCVQKKKSPAYSDCTSCILKYNKFHFYFVDFTLASTASAAVSLEQIAFSLTKGKISQDRLMGVTGQ